MLFTASAGVDMAFTMGSMHKVSNTAAATERLKNKVTVFPIVTSTCFSFFAPVSWPMETVVPIASPTIITVIICIIWLPIETAVVLSTALNCPTIYRSAIPYSVCRKQEKK